MVPPACLSTSRRILALCPPCPSPFLRSSDPRYLPQHENNAITLLYTNCLWLKHHDDPISILHFEYSLHIPSILFCIQILVIFWDTVFRQFSHESIQKNDPKFAHRIKYFELPNSLQIRDPEWDHHDVSTINN